MLLNKLLLLGLSMVCMSAGYGAVRQQIASSKLISTVVSFDSPNSSLTLDEIDHHLYVRNMFVLLGVLTILIMIIITGIKRTNQPSSYK